MEQPYTVIGAGGAIGAPLAQELLKNGKLVRLLSRSGKTMDGAESRSVDVFNQKELTEAIRGSKVAFLLVGLDYNTKLWEEKWPIVMQNTLNACAETGVPLVFFDNVYMYGPVKGKMTEETPFNPSSKKGVVRAKIATMLLEAVKRGEVTACIARSADFYGPIMKEMVEMVYQNEQSYWFDSSKFEQKYGFQPTSYEDGIRETVKFFNLRKNA